MPIDPIKALQALADMRDKLAPEQLAQLVAIAKESRIVDPRLAVTVALTTVGIEEAKQQGDAAKLDSFGVFSAASKIVFNAAVYTPTFNRLNRELNPRSVRTPSAD